MQISTRTVQDVLVVDLAGRLDSHTAGDVGDRMDGIGTGDAKRVLLNLGGLDYVSSAGLRVVLRLSRLLQAHGGELRVSDAQPMVAQVLDTAGFHSLLLLHPTESDALAAFSVGWMP